MTIKDTKIYRACLYEGSKREKDKNFFTDMEAIAYCLNNIKDTHSVVELTVNFDDVKCVTKTIMVTIILVAIQRSNSITNILIGLTNTMITPCI